MFKERVLFVRDFFLNYLLSVVLIEWMEWNRAQSVYERRWGVSVRDSSHVFLRLTGSKGLFVLCVSVLLLSPTLFEGPGTLEGPGSGVDGWVAQETKYKWDVGKVTTEVYRHTRALVTNTTVKFLGSEVSFPLSTHGGGG